MKKIGLYLTIALFMGVLLSIPLVFGVYVGKIIAKILLSFNII